MYHNVKQLWCPLLVSAGLGLIGLFVAGCAHRERDEPAKIGACDRPRIEAAMQSLYGTSGREIAEITRVIHFLQFSETCAVQTVVRTPVGVGLLGQTRPDISLGWNVEYWISRRDGICIVRKAVPESAGVYSDCFK